MDRKRSAEGYLHHFRSSFRTPYNNDFDVIYSNIAYYTYYQISSIGVFLSNIIKYNHIS